MTPPGRVLIVTAVEAERGVMPQREGVVVISGGIGRTNAAAATTEAILRHGPCSAVICAGIAGALPCIRSAQELGPAPGHPPSDPRRSSLRIGEIVLASECVYLEEGLATPEGFTDMRGLGFPLGDFEGNRVPVDARLLDAVSARLGAPDAPGCRVGPVATVATCSGRDDAAREVVRRTGAIAEAMEGAAVVHAARRLGVPAIELRSVSNTTGDRPRQQWNIAAALNALRAVMPLAVEAVRDAGCRTPAGTPASKKASP